MKKLFFTLGFITFINAVFAQSIDQSYQGEGDTKPSDTPNKFYGGFVSNDAVNYPSTYGSIFGFSYSPNGYGYSYQIFKGHTSAKLFVRFADYSSGGDKWFSWNRILDSGNDIESTGSLKINGLNNNYIMGRLGIGETNPTLGQLQLKGSGNDMGITFSNGPGTGDSFRLFTENNIAYLSRGDGSDHRKLTINGSGMIGLGGVDNATLGRIEIRGSGETNGIAFWNGTGDSFRIFTKNGIAYLSRGDGSDHRKITINGSGFMGIGTSSPDYKLDVCGTIRAKEVKVNLEGTCVPDFVFKPDYKLMDLNTLEQFVKLNHHLPEIAPEKEMSVNGINMKEMQMKLLQKIEELTLYTIEQEKKIEELEKQNDRIIILEKKIEELVKATNP